MSGDACGAASGTGRTSSACGDEARDRGEPGRSQAGAGGRRQSDEDLQVAVGKPSTPSPVGTFTIERRVMNPTYSHDGRVVPPGPNNPVGTRWMGLSIPRLRNSWNQCAELDRQGRIARMHSHGEGRSGRALPDGRGGRHGGVDRPAQRGDGAVVRRCARCRFLARSRQR